MRKFVILGVFALLVAGIWWKWPLIWPTVGPVVTSIKKFNLSALPKFPNPDQQKIKSEEISSGFNQIKNQALNSGEKLGEVGSTIAKLASSMEQIKQVDSGTGGPTALQDKVFESARYLYCQEVVKDYELKLASASAQKNN